MDDNGDLRNGAVAAFRAEGVVIEDYVTLGDAEQKRILHAVMMDLPPIKNLVTEEQTAYEALGLQYRGTEEALEKAAKKLAKVEVNKAIALRAKQGKMRAGASGTKYAEQAVAVVKKMPEATRSVRRAVWRQYWMKMQDVSQIRLASRREAAFKAFCLVINNFENDAMDRLTHRDAAAMGYTPGYRAVVGKRKSEVARLEQAAQEGVADVPSDDEGDSDFDISE